MTNRPQVLLLTLGRGPGFDFIPGRHCSAGQAGATILGTPWLVGDSTLPNTYPHTHCQSLSHLQEPPCQLLHLILPPSKAHRARVMMLILQVRKLSCKQASCILGQQVRELQLERRQVCGLQASTLSLPPWTWRPLLSWIGPPATSGLPQQKDF